MNLMNLNLIPIVIEQTSKGERSKWTGFFLFGLLVECRKDYSDLYRETKQVNPGEDGLDSGKSSVSSFLENWGWEYSVDQCRENAGITEDEVYTQWNVIQFMNKLSYLKDKGKFEIALRG